jgi:hypothetical protein
MISASPGALLGKEMADRLQLSVGDSFHPRVRGSRAATG